MTNWIDFTIVGEQIVENLFGSHIFFSVAIVMLFLVGMMVLGIELRYTSPFILPLAAIFFAEGWFGANAWIYSVIVLFVALVYAFAIIRLTSR